MTTETQTLEIQSTVETPSKKRRGPGLRPMTWAAKIRRRFPAIPVRGLWDQASEEEKLKAHERSVVLMEFWVGRITSDEARLKLNLTPLRFWQMSQQAVAGVTAGLLTQPRKKMGDLVAKTNSDEDPKKLLAKIKELERMIETQNALIKILRSMPMQREAVGEKSKSTRAVPDSTEKKDRKVSAKGSKRKSEAGS